MQIWSIYLRMVQFGSMLVMVGSSVYMYLVSEFVTSALSIIKRTGAGPEPDREAGVMQIISRLVRLVREKKRNMSHTFILLIFVLVVIRINRSKLT